MNSMALESATGHRAATTAAAPARSMALTTPVNSSPSRTASSPLLHALRTTTSTGLVVRAELDPRPYAKGVTVSDAELAAVRIRRAKFHGEWNYTISPRT